MKHQLWKKTQLVHKRFFFNFYLINNFSAIPKPPTDVKATDLKSDSVTISWTPPEQGKDLVGPKALFYNVEILDPNTGVWETVNEAPIRGNSLKGIFILN